jgi:hypothetical protein
MKFCALTLLCLLLSCDDGVILDKDPFYRAQIPLSVTEVPGFIGASERYATQVGLAHTTNTFGNGKFSVLIFSSDLNISALNTVKPGVVEISATARGDPTSVEAGLVREYVSYVRAYIAVQQNHG